MRFSIFPAVTHREEAICLHSEGRREGLLSAGGHWHQSLGPSSLERLVQADVSVPWYSSNPPKHGG